jgi:ketosteroid isomerase-like protein
VFFIFPNSVGSLSTRIVERALAKPRQRVIFLQRRMFALLRGLRLNFISASSCRYQMRKIWCKLTGWGSSTAESADFLPIAGGYMKGAIFAVVLLTLGCFSLPIFAQQQDLQEVMNAANALSVRESELLSKKDAAGIASLFTSDGLLVMLAPQFAFKPGRDAIQKHYQGIIDAGATSITLELKNLVPRGDDGLWATGAYSVTVKDKIIQGNWFRILKRENGNWKIAMEAFARAGFIEAPPAAASSPPTPTR